MPPSKIAIDAPDLPLPDYISLERSQTGLALICQACKPLGAFVDGVFARLAVDHNHPGLVAQAHIQIFHQTKA